MAESVTFNIWKRWGAVEHTKELILRQGTELFGEPTDAVREAIMRIETTELPRLDALSVRLLKVNSWDELLAGPAPAKKAAKRKKPKA